NIIGIELLNEIRWDTNLEIVQNFYNSGYSLIELNGGMKDSEWITFIGDSFRLNSWNEFMQPPYFQNIYLDTHIYHVFDYNVLKYTQQQHIDKACINDKQAIVNIDSNTNGGLWVVVGEFSLAT